MINVALLGAGYFSRFHRDAWCRNPRVRVVGCHDANPAAQAEVQHFATLSALLDTQPDLLDIITPPATHATAIHAAIAHGIRTVICQKPFCTSLTEAREITATAAAAGLTLIIHENFRFQPWYRAIAAELAKGSIGDLHQMTFRLRTGDGQGPRAYLDRQPYFQTMPRLLIHETGVHWVDTFRYLMGDPVAVYADLRRINPVIKGEDAATVIFDYPGGKRAVFDANRHLDHATDNPRRTFGEALVEGTKGTLSLHGTGAVTLRAFGAADQTVLLPAQDWPGFAGDCVRALQDHVIRHLTDAAPLENTAAEYLRVIEVEQAIYQSATEQRRISL